MNLSMLWNCHKVCDNIFLSDTKLTWVPGFPSLAFGSIQTRVSRATRESWQSHKACITQNT